jgi:hypothetical protein
MVRGNTVNVVVSELFESECKELTNYAEIKTETETETARTSQATKAGERPAA